MGPRFNASFRILAQVGKVAYRLDLPTNLSQIHSMFHVSQLWKCLTHDSIVVPVDNIQEDECLNYMERPVMILDKKTKTLCNKVLELVKVQWQHQKGPEWIWEPNEELREHYPELFAATDFEEEV